MTTFYERLLAPLYSPQKSFGGKARVRFFDKGYRVLVSYTTEICCFNPTTGHLEMLCLESDLTPTTMKHLREFLAQSGFRELSKDSKDAIVAYLRD